MRNNKQSWADLFCPSCFESGKPMVDDWFRLGDTDEERSELTGLDGVDPELPCDELLPR